MNTHAIDELLVKLHNIDGKLSWLRQFGTKDEIEKYQSYRKSIISAIVEYKLNEYEGKGNIETPAIRKGLSERL